YLDAEAPSRRPRDLVGELVNAGRDAREAVAALLVGPDAEVCDADRIRVKKECHPLHRHHVSGVPLECDAAADAGGGWLRSSVGWLLGRLRRLSLNSSRTAQRPDTLEPAPRPAHLVRGRQSVLQHPPELFDGLVAPIEIRDGYAEAVV